MCVHKYNHFHLQNYHQQQRQMSSNGRWSPPAIFASRNATLRALQYKKQLTQNTNNQNTYPIAEYSSRTSTNWKHTKTQTKSGIVTGTVMFRPLVNASVQQFSHL